MQSPSFLCEPKKQNTGPHLFNEGSQTDETFSLSTFCFAVSVLGLGETGITLAAGLTAMGHSVICTDYDLRLVSSINDGHFRSGKSDLDALLISGVKNSDLIATCDTCNAVRHSQVVFVCQTSAEQDPKSNGQLFDTKQNQWQELAIILGKMKHYRSLVYARKLKSSGGDQALIAALESGSNKKCGKDFGFCLLPCFSNKHQAPKDLHNADPTHSVGKAPLKLSLNSLVLNALSGPTDCSK